MEKLLILDSNSLLNRAYYAQPLIENNEGISTNAIYGFTNILVEMKEKIKPDYIMAAFDSEGPSFRSKEYEQYKLTSNMPKELKEQIPLIKKLLSLLSINIFEIDGYEADDIINTVVKAARENNIEVSIVTAADDVFNLISDNVKVVKIQRGLNQVIDYNMESFEEKFKLEPHKYIEVKALKGCQQKNINCISGIGERTAFNIISENGSIDSLYENIDNIIIKKIRENLEKSKEQVFLNKKLLTLAEIENFNISFEDIKVNENIDKQGVQKFLIDLNLENAAKKLLNEEISVEKENTIDKVDNLDRFKEVLNNQEENSYICYLVEGESRFSTMELSKIIFASETESIEIDFKKIAEANKAEAYEALKIFMEDGNKHKVIHDGKHLLTVLAKNNIDIKSFVFDTAIAAYLIDSSKGEYSLKILVKQYLDEEIKGDSEEVLCKSAIYMKKLFYILKDKIKEDDMEKLYNDIELPLVTVLSYMESQGFNVDKDMLDTLAVKFKEEIEKTQKEVYELAEEEFNISSPKQLGKILFEKLDLPVIKKTKTGYSTNAEVLDKLIDKHPIIEKIIYYRQITKLNSTYIEGLKNVIDEDGKIHSSFNQTVTTTGRLSSTEPNLQNIPVKYEMGREIRKVFIPNEEGDILLSCDYSQIELRVLAHIADDENMINAFTYHSDIHTKTASEVFNVPIDEVTSIMRSRAKAVNFGIVYGISDFSLAQDLKITKKEASEYMNIYFDRYPKIKLYLDEIIEDAMRDGYVSTIFNRRRFIPEIKASNKIVKALGERLAMNAPIQGSAADIIKIAMVNVYNRLKKEKLKSSLILQVHDELILNVKPNEEEKVRALVKEEMEKALTLHVPLEVDVNEGTTWYEAK